MADKKLNGTVIVTYRCNARCTMCNRYKAPSKPEEEISIETIKKLPPMYFTNITGGEPFIRTDLRDIVAELRKKSDRIVISTNGFFTDRIVALCKEFPSHWTDCKAVQDHEHSCPELSYQIQHPSCPSLLKS